MRFKNIAYYGLIAIINLMMISCKVGSQQLHYVKFPERFYQSENRSTDTLTIANLSWQEYFEDKTLQALIKKGVNNNYDLLIAIKRIETAQERLKAARILQLPTATVAVAAKSTSPSDNSLEGISLNNFVGQKHIEDYIAGINLSWEADIWGKIKSQKDVLLKQYLQTYEAKKAIQTQIVSQIAHSYYNLLMLDTQLETAKKNLSLNDTIFTVTQLQYHAGMETNLAVKQAAAQKQFVGTLIPQLEEQIALEENVLNILTGTSLEKVSRNGILSEIQLPNILQHGVPADLLSNRPDIRDYELSVKIRNSEVGIAQANTYPSLNISASIGVNSFRASNWFQTPASLFASIMGGIAQPLLQKRTLKTNLAVAKINRDEAVLEFRKSVLDAVREVSDALVRSEKLKIEYRETEQYSKILQLAINDSKQLYKNGLANYIELIMVQSNALKAELALASVRRRQLGACVDLYRALGGGWR
ncbi:efflux transporter outer membrane subunit [Chryseobacterium sp. 09-1422]|uniref:Efflux transporter outer membrane subunit n=1 Tax=Chryseobacterium kimseyorum TaxID=2984028 RepID=A0ABT3I3N0_9FLAO|nr:efflux transporter outer membrane subunit [Chryseobacterium kimseyorum]MCW3170671.1 efflux transporter outer membrane subunit [Chryseobacterium kimseyorum]